MGKAGTGMKYFNTEGVCRPEEHYMVRLDERLEQIKEKLVDRKKYFVISRGRQYGKTTTLNALERYLGNWYTVLALDFQLMGTEDFADETAFVKAFAGAVMAAVDLAESYDREELQRPLKEIAGQGEACGLQMMFVRLSRMCQMASKPIVLMIDEVDSAANYQVFIDFLAQLRGYYQRRDRIPAFHSVILAGVYDIQNLRLKLRPESEHQYNSPWNIAAKFNVDMSFSAEEIAGMLQEYETDHHSGMNIGQVAEEIYAYTSGYPVLVSSICRYISEELCGESGLEISPKAWSAEGVRQAVASLLKENPPLFESMAKQLERYADLRAIIEDILYRGKKIPFSPEEKFIQLGTMFGFLKEENGHVAIANRLFEMCLLNLFMAREAIASDVFARGEADRVQFIRNNRLDMDLVLKKFVEYFHEIYGEKDMKFVESYGRKFFLLYLKPIINGTGNYYIEAQTRDARRTDVIVDYLGEQFIVELKLWRGNEYRERGEEQLIDYLEYYHKEKGYMLSFNFNRKKEIGVKEHFIHGKIIVEAVV